MRRLITLVVPLVLSVVVVTIAARASGPVAAAEPGSLAPLSTQDLSLAQAQAVLGASLAAAEEQGTRMDIAVVDAGGNLKAFARMDGAWLGSIASPRPRPTPPATSTCPPRSWGSCRNRGDRSIKSRFPMAA
jgi:hypothetical protein